MNTHELTFAAVAAAMTVAPAFMTSASAKIRPVIIEQHCENPADSQPPGRQPVCQGQTQEQVTVTENQNPAGHAPPGQNP
jgi:hypothetical protein